jgi:hypothetical protein
MTDDEELVIEAVRQGRLHIGPDECIYVDSAEVPGVYGALFDLIDQYNAKLITDFLDIGMLSESDARNDRGYRQIIVAQEEK